MSEKEFYDAKHIISPNKFEVNNDNARPPKDFKEWSKDGGADRNTSKAIIDEWFKNQ